ncbi:pilin [Staphylococcus epidermidis]|nr:pilin [Staphylococcus epidermidis]MCG1591654.1 pilin [Staphylococcus epidermidis]MCG2478645.1 pilin [Staphylococcus epidermidis]
MNHLTDLIFYLHLNNILEIFQYNDVFENAKNIFNRILEGLKIVAPVAGAVCLAIGAYFWMFAGEAGKQTAKKWWIGTAVAIAVIFGANAIIDWLRQNAKF